MRHVLAYQNPCLRALFLKSRKLQALNQSLQKSLPLKLQKRVTLANLREDQAIFMIPSAEWVIPFKMHAPKILKIIQLHLPQIKSVQWTLSK